MAADRTACGRACHQPEEGTGVLQAHRLHHWCRVRADLLCSRLRSSMAQIDIALVEDIQSIAAIFEKSAGLPLPAEAAEFSGLPSTASAGINLRSLLVQCGMLLNQ